MNRLVKVEVVNQAEAALKLDDLLLFEAAFLDVTTRQELLRLLPRLVHVRRARQKIFHVRGCLTCQKPDPTVAIAARLRRKGQGWSEIYELVGLDHDSMSRDKRKQFEVAVRRKMTQPNVPERKPSARYGAGGMCDCCYARARRAISAEVRKMHQGRDTKTEIADLSRRFDLAQFLLGNGDEQ